MFHLSFGGPGLSCTIQLVEMALDAQLALVGAVVIRPSQHVEVRLQAEVLRFQVLTAEVALFNKSKMLIGLNIYIDMCIHIYISTKYISIHTHMTH